MKRRITGWKADFPIHESVEDFAGKQRKFVINCHEGGLGYTVRASEEGKDGLGYQFASYSETSPYSALGRVRDKMSRVASPPVTPQPPTASAGCCTTR